MRLRAVTVFVAIMAIACGGTTSTTTDAGAGGQLPALKNHVNITFWHAMHARSPPSSSWRPSSTPASPR